MTAPDTQRLAYLADLLALVSDEDFAAYQGQVTNSFRGKQTKHREHAGLRAIIAGDSIAKGADGVTNGHVGSWFTYLAALSYGAIRRVRNAGVAGSTSTQMLARFAADVLAYRPELVVIEGITPNDKAGSDTALVSKSKANIVAMVDQALAIGARVAVCTGPPNNDATINARMQEMTTWIRSYAATHGLDLWDLYTPIADPATGRLAAQYDVGDGVHPNAEGREAIAQAVWARISTDLLPGGILATPSDADNLLAARGLFVAATTTAAVADGVVSNSVPTASRTERTDGLGYWQTLTGTAATQAFDFDVTYLPGTAIDPANLAFRPGDVFSFAGEMENVDSTGFNAQVNVVVGQTTNQIRAISSWGLAGKGPRTFYIEDTIPADYVGNAVRVRLTPGVGTVRFSRVRIVNITAQERARKLSTAVLAALLLKADAAAVYSKSDSDARYAAAGTAGGSVDAYTKTQSDDKYATKVAAGQLADTLGTSIQTAQTTANEAKTASTNNASAIGDRALKTDVYAKSETYSRAQTDTQIGTKVGIILIPANGVIPEGTPAGTLVLERKA